MKLKFMPRLEHIIFVKFALRFYQDRDIEKLLQKERQLQSEYLRFNCSRYNLWKQIKTKVGEKFVSSKKPLPKLSSIKVARILEGLHLEAEQWIDDHNSLLKLSPSCSRVPYKSIFCWYSDGTINRKETAKNFVESENFDPNTRFVMACTYFLEYDVFALWNGNNEVNEERILQQGTNFAVRFWLNMLKNGSIKPWRQIVDHCFRIPSILPSDIFVRLSGIFPYLSWVGKHNYSKDFLSLHEDDFRMCMHEMGEKESTELFKAIPSDILRKCLKWPFQTIFMDVANRLWSHMLCEDFLEVLREILIYYILRGLMDFDYFELLKEFWNMSPSSFKKDIKVDEDFYKMIELVINYEGQTHTLYLEDMLDKYALIYKNKH